MKKIVFLGAPDKSHLLLILGKLLAVTGQKVIVVDSTLRQGVQGYMPDSEAHLPIREFEGMDVARGFVTPVQLERHLQGNYDVLLLDTDHTEFVKGRDLAAYDKRVWCSSYGRLHLQRNAELMQRLCLHEAEGRPLPFYKMLTQHVPVSITEAYVDELLDTQHMQWEEAAFRFALDERNTSVELDNQHHSRLDVRRLTGSYRRTVLDMVKHLLEWDERTVQQAWKQLRKARIRGRN
ncbi:hypothetical protein PPYC1_20115 [Paenibacillus polymyxa]|uniref:hypothetical protein n=1 Tax=Paenibacillus polymyxa TaxID=1406 RepID=UPI0008FC820A|nr:hypothetical protein [Paenibacillus polymyxa]APB72536.1 hypothetical protein PPYC1_20115 [Paenibacillus polymyxa]